MQKVKIIFNQTMMISTAILFEIGIQTLIQHLISGAKSFTWAWYFPISICVVGFLCSLPTYFILDLDGVNRREIWIRIGIHFILVGVILGLCGCLFHWYDSLFDFIAIIPVYIIIYIFIWGVMGWFAKVDERKINEAIKNVRDVE